MEAALDLELLFPVHTSHLCKKSSTDKSNVEREAKRRDTFFLFFLSKELTLHVMESLGVPYAPIWERVHEKRLEGDWDLTPKSTPQGLRSIIAANIHALLLLLCRFVRLHYTTVQKRSAHHAGSPAVAAGGVQMQRAAPAVTLSRLAEFLRSLRGALRKRRPELTSTQVQRLSRLQFLEMAHYEMLTTFVS